MEDIAAIGEGNLSPYFKGVAKVQISALDFGHALSSERHRPLSEKTVARLVDILRREGCRRDDGANFVDAVVDDDALQAALAEVALSNADLKSWSITHPVIPLQRVQCLHGLHRIAAARSLLDKNDQWWTVRLYSDLPKDLGIKVIEGSVNEQPYADGIILRKILLYRREGNEALENKWWARLSTTKQKDLKQLLKKPLFMNALNELLDMPGLWYPIKLGTLHRLLTLRCDEELLRYLQHVRTVWSSILQCGEDQVSAEVVDRLTVERLDLLAPAASERDSKIIENLFRSGEIFGQVSNEAVRGRIKSNLSSVQVLIPTLRSFFENLKYLEPCSLILKRLLDPDDKRSIYRCLKAAYFSPSSQFIEYAEGRVHEYSNKTASEDMWTSYVQLWAFCFRNFPNMTSLEPRKELGKEKPSTTTNAALWHHLGNLAVKLGFRTEQAVIFQQESPYFTLAQQVIQSAHPGLTPDSSLVSQIARLLEHTSGDSPERNAVALTSNVTLPVERRCGRPFEDDHIRDREFMFLPIVYETETSHGPDISSFYVKQDLFKSFFGDLYVMDRENAEAVIENISQSLPLESSPFMGICHGTCDTARAAREECQLSTRKIAELEAQISTYQSNGRHLDDMQQHLLDKTRECEDLTRRLRQGEDCVRREKQQQAASNDKIEEQGKKIKELASNLNNALEVHAQCANLTHEHEKRFNEIQARLTAKEAELRNILEDRDKLSAARENQEECSQILERIRGENKRLEQELKDLQVIVARSDEEAEMRSKEASILREEIKRLQDIETQTSTEKAATEQELDHLTRNNHEVEEQNKRLLEELADMRRQLLERTTRLEEADGRINSLETLFKSSEVKEMREMNQRLKKDKAELEKQIGDLQARQNHEVSTLQRRMTEASGFDDPRYQELFILARRAEHKAVAYPYCFTVVMGPQKRPIHIRLENDQHLHKTLDDIIAIITRIELETNGVWSIYALQEGKQPGKLPSTDNIVDVLKKCKNIYAGTQQHMDEWHNAQTTSLENKGKRKRLHGDA